jgi:hypothetical protein
VCEKRVARRQRNQPSHSTVLARPVCPFVCVSAASFPCRFPDERTPIEATPLSATSTELGLGWGLGLGLDSLSHPSSHALSLSKGRTQGAPSDLKMPLENDRAEEERVSRGQASERAVCV